MSERGLKLAVSLTSDISTRTSQNVKKTQKPNNKHLEIVKLLVTRRKKKIKDHHMLPLYGMTLALGNIGEFVYTDVYFTISTALVPSAKWQLFPTLLSQNTLVKLSKGCLQKPPGEQDAKAHQRSTQQREEGNTGWTNGHNLKNLQQNGINLQCQPKEC